MSVNYGAQLTPTAAALKAKLYWHSTRLRMEYVTPTGLVRSLTVLDNWLNVLDYGCKMDGSDDTAALQAMINAAADGSIIFIPAGTVYITGTVNIPLGKHLVIKGAGWYKSKISTSHATADMFTFSDWEQEVEDLTFQASVTRTGGYCLNFGTMNICRVSRCQFVSPYNGILHSGTIGVFDTLVMNNTVNYGITMDSDQVNDVIANCTMDCAPAAAAHVFVKRCGSLMIAGSDFIRATNNLLINPSVSNGANGIYATNSMFDQAAGSSILISGSGAAINAQRMKFTNCWIQSAGTWGMEVNGASTTLPDAIDLVNCDFYQCPTGGLKWNAGQGFSISSSRFAGNGIGISLVPAAGAVTKALISGNNTIGPTGQLAGNTTGIQIAAGTYGQLLIANNNVQGNTTNISDLGGIVTGLNQRPIKDNLGHLFLGAMASVAADVAVAANANTVIVGGLNNYPIPANSIRAGTTFRIILTGSFTQATAGTAVAVQVHLGTAGTTGDAVILTFALTSGVGTSVARIEINLTFRTNGATGTVVGHMEVSQHAAAIVGISNAAGGVSEIQGTTTTAPNTTTANYLTVSILSAASGITGTVKVAEIEVVQI